MLETMPRWGAAVVCSGFLVVGCDQGLSPVPQDGDKPTIEDFEPGSPEKPDTTGADAIVNGQDASPGEYPWVVYAGGCGGTLIGPSWVMTAAHCASEYRIGSWVNIGGLRVSDMVEQTDGEWRRVAGGACHPNYRTSGHDYDYCVVQLDEPSTAPPIRIDRSSSTHAGTTAVVVGWGTLWQGGATSDVLEEAALPVLDMATCAQMYGGAITSRMLCAGYVQGGVDSCQGDSGGPLVSTVTGELIGVVSWGAGCGQAYAPGVYARVNAVDEWICEVTGGEALGCAAPSGPEPAQEPTASCVVDHPSYVGDGYCDRGAYNTAACGYDGGDCCPATCQPGDYACGSNGYECLDGEARGVCTAPRPDWIGDGYCDRDPAYNNAACAFDGGDCCEETCQAGDHACGSNGYQCLDPAF